MIELINFKDMSKQEVWVKSMIGKKKNDRIGGPLV